MGEAIPGPGPCSFISLVAEDGLQEEDHLGKQSFVPKAINQEIFFPGNWRLGL